MGIRLRFRRMVLFSILTLLTIMAVPTASMAATGVAETIQLEQPANQRPGNSVALSGTTTLNQVSIKVVQPDATILYFDTATMREGGFVASFTLPDDAANGTYTVVAGKGAIVATRTFDVTRSTDPGTPTPGTPTPSTPAPGTGGSSEEGVHLADAATPLRTEKLADGRTITTATADAEALRTAIADAFKKDPNHPIVIIGITGEHDALRVELPAAVIRDAAASSAGTVIVVKDARTSYRLPIGLEQLQTTIRSLGTLPKDAIVSIRIEAITGDLRDRMVAAAKQAGLTLRDAGFDYSVNVEANGQSVPVNGFGGTFVTRSFVIAGSVDPAKATAVSFDPATGRFAFVPSVFDKNGDRTTVTIRRNGNSAYAVIEAAPSFSDIASHWAKADIGTMAAKQIVQGLGEGRFAPDRTITRAEFAALLVRSLGMTVSSEASTFSDIPAGAWYAGSVATAVDAQLVTGTGAGRFQPDAPVTREQAAVLIARALDFAGMTATGTQATAALADANRISGWANESVGSLLRAGIIEGYPDGSFKPQLDVSRSQAAVLLKRMLEHASLINR